MEIVYFTLGITEWNQQLSSNNLGVSTLEETAIHEQESCVKDKERIERHNYQILNTSLMILQPLDT